MALLRPLAGVATTLAVVATARTQCVSLGAFANTGTVPTGLSPAGTCTEISGIAASRQNPGVLWVHDDSGNAAQLVALRSNGALARQYSMPGVANRDWEDVQLGPGPIAGRDYLYVAELGNNALGYTTFSLLRVPEPVVPAGNGPTLALPAPEVFAFHYPSGTANAETLWIDPVDGAPWILTKVNATTCALYRYPLPLQAGIDKALVLEAIVTGMPVLFTGGAISADGRWIFARTNTTICAWSRPAGTSFAAAFASAACTFAASQGQAEAIAVSADGAHLWAVSEGAGAAVRRAPIGWPAGAPLWHAFGTGLGGPAGAPGLGATAAPRLSAPFAVGTWRLPANANALLIASTSGLDDGAWAWNGGWLHAVPDLVFDLVVDASGAATLAIAPLPDLPALHGLPLFAQVVAVDAQAPQGYSLSAGLRLVLDR